jgi:hypothetical protein
MALPGQGACARECKQDAATGNAATTAKTRLLRIAPPSALAERSASLQQLRCLHHACSGFLAYLLACVPVFLSALILRAPGRYKDMICFYMDIAPMA